MNIEQYRALKAQEQEQEQANQTPEQTPVVEQTQEPQETQPNETKPEDKPTEEPKTPEVTEIEIDGVGKVSIDELKNGYLRQSDYTKKTQDISRQRKELEEAVAFYENIKQNPELAQQLSTVTKVPANLDPTQAKVIELENKLYDMMLEREIETLQKKYPDFEVMEVLKVAQEKGITDLNDAYHLSKANKPVTQNNVNIDEIKTQLREELKQELLKEMDANKNTSTIISTNNQGAPITDNTPKLSEAESKVARMMKMSEKEYIKWRDAK